MKKQIHITVLLLVLFISCKKNLAPIISSEIQEFKKEGFEWTISQVSTTYQININKSIVLSKNKVPHSILFSVKSNTVKEFILCSKKNSNWIAHFITLRDVDAGETFLEVRDLKRILKGVHPLLNGTTSLKSNSIFSPAEENKIRSMSLPPVSVTGYRRNIGLNYISMYWAHGGNADFRNDYFGEVETFHQDEAGGGGEMIEVLEADADNSAYKDTIDINKFIDCYGNIPKEGASYSVKIHADIPVNAYPDLLFDLQKFSPVHVFISLLKKGRNGTEINQSFGFYPDRGFKSILGAEDFVKGKIVNDGIIGSEHEYNAAYSVSASHEQFERILNRLRNLRSPEYSLLNANCAHFAISIFNEVSPDFSSSPKSYYFGGFMKYITASPVGVYNMIQLYQSSHYANVEFGVVKKSSPSKGSCN